MAMDSNQHLWIATRNGRLLVLRLTPYRQPYVSLIYDLSNQVNLPHFRSITIDNNNTVWLGTRYNGICHLAFSGEKKIFESHFTTSNGLTDNFIGFLMTDNDNNVWIGTQTGLDKIYRKNRQYVVSNLTKSNNIFETITRIVTLSDNTAWVMNSQGSLLKITPPGSTELPPPPELLLTECKVNNQYVPYSTNEFSFKENNFSFSV